MNLKVLAIIPARGGSKRLPGKNIKILHGKPMINWTVEAALQSKYITKLHVSTDDPEIAKVVKCYGLPHTALRPAELSTDSISTMDVIKYVYSVEGTFDVIVLLQPTSPLRKSYHIDEAIELYISKNAQSVVSITPCEHDPRWSNFLDDECCLNNFIRPALASELNKKPFRLNGAIYVFDAKKLNDNNVNIYDKRSYGYIMSQRYSVDIDYEDDFYYAEFLLEKELTN